MMGSWHVGPLGDDIEDYISIAGECLLYPNAELWKTYIRRVGQENIYGVRSDSGKLHGGLAFYRMGQWFGGRCLPCAGVSGVAIEPAARGAGACRSLLVHFLQSMANEGIPLASLYASTQHLYRTVGFEQSGHRMTYSMPMASLRASKPARSVGVTRCNRPAFSVLEELHRERAKLTNGNLDRTEGLWERVIDPIDQSTVTYLIGPEERPEGFIVLHHGHRSAGYPQPLIASDWAVSTPRAMQRLIALVLDHRSMCDRFQWSGGPDDMLPFAADEQNVDIVGQLRWLNRVVQFRGALEGRGYPQELTCELHFAIEDELLEENRGNWLVTIENGTARVERGGNGSIEADISAIAPLHSSLYSCSQLAAAGRLRCADAQQMTFADAAFAGPVPWMTEMF